MATNDLGVVKPVMKGAHVVANTYEVLNMVESGGKVYMANKDVPADTPIDSAEFWTNMSGTGMTTDQLQAWAVTTISDANKILTETEYAIISDNMLTLTNDTQDNTTAITTKIGVTDYATSTVGGTLKVRLDGEKAYFTVDGSDA
jgi:hypothetical protein